MFYALLPILQADYHGHMDWDDGWGVVMGIGMVLFWVVVALGVIWLVREVIAGRNQTSAGSTSVSDDPLRILERRLADGSIPPEEYRERRATLTGSG
jgi:putative membrane protein